MDFYKLEGTRFNYPLVVSAGLRVCGHHDHDCQEEQPPDQLPARLPPCNYLLPCLVPPHTLSYIPQISLATFLMTCQSACWLLWSPVDIE